MYFVVSRASSGVQLRNGHNRPSVKPVITVITLNRAHFISFFMRIDGADFSIIT